MSFIAVFTQEKDGRFSVSVPALPGCFSQGDTFEEAKVNITEAIGLYVEDENFDPEIAVETQIIASIVVPKL